MRPSLSRWIGVRAIGLTAALACAFSFPLLPQEDAIESAVVALERGDLSSAEQILQARLRVQPKDRAALGVLGVVLDKEKKYDEADLIYRRALSSSSPDAALLNNFGNHLLATGKLAEARKPFLKAIALEPGNANALVQLAHIALGKKAAAEALGYLDRIVTPAQDRTDAAMLRMQANYALGNQRNGDAILAHLSLDTEADPGRNFTLGVALASVGQYDKAEIFFSKTVDATPDNFEALYDLGLAASHAGHNERARSVLREAIAKQPENVDVLYDLAAVNVALDDREAALELLARASRLAPKRTDVRQLEARTAASLGYFADARNAWDEYLKLVPGDDVARRERAFAETAIGEHMTEGMAELNAFVRKHPGDAMGHYELGTAEAAQQPGEALKQLDHALALQSDLTGAHIARGLLLYRQVKLKEALADFELAAKKEPKNGAVLDRLGETYMALDRTSDALPVLRKAAGLLPSNSTILLHLGRALSKAGQPAEASAIFARCRELGPNRSASSHPAGLVEFLGLSPDEQRAKYRAGVVHTVQSNPDNVEAQVRYLGILLEDDRTDDAAAVVHTLCTLKLSPNLLTDSVHMLVNARQYQLAKQLLEQSASAIPPELALDLAIADLHVVSAEAGLNVLQSIPKAQQGGDYYLVQAQILQAQNRPQDAKLAIHEAMQATPTRPELYRSAALLLIEDRDLPDAAAFLSKAVRIAPDDADLLLLQTLTLELNGTPASSDAQFRKIESRWPEWYKPWIMHALVLEARRQKEQAEPIRQTAGALGAPDEVLKLGPDALTAPNLSRTLGFLFP